ncbi:MAG: basic secretory protein-like protein [Armatimonadota bacterium]
MKIIILLPFIFAVIITTVYAASSEPVDDKATAKAPIPVKITINTSEAPECAEWASPAYKAIEEWYPKISRMLETERFTPWSEVTVNIKAKCDGIAATGGDGIDVSADWIRQHPDDIGMVVHEVVHWIQQYPDYNTPWLVEGIADYIRYFRYEPRDEYPILDPAKSSYRDGYMTSAMFLAWVEQKRCKTIISDMNKTLRKGDYNYDMWRKLTGRNLDRLWSEFIEAARKKGGIKATKKMK